MRAWGPVPALQQEGHQHTRFGPGAQQQHPPTKTSIGVILCRINAASGRPEVLLVHKRYTYAFAEFVHGRYARGRAVPGGAQRSVGALLDNMTTDELLDVWSLNFEQMWYRVWLSRDKREIYNKKCAKFQSTFLRDDSGDALRRAVSQARSRGSLIWEVPKGRRLSPREADVLCAVRELREETGVDKGEYRLLPDAKRRVSYVSAGTRYVCAYYVALAGPRLAATARGPGGPGRPTLYAKGAPPSTIDHMGEVSEVRWFDVERVRLLDEPERLEALVAPAFRMVKKYIKGRWASRRGPGAPPLCGPEDPSRPPSGQGLRPGERPEEQEPRSHGAGSPPAAEPGPPDGARADAPAWRAGGARGGARGGGPRV